jgi:hypothetical protein
VVGFVAANAWVRVCGAGAQAGKGARMLSEKGWQMIEREKGVCEIARDYRARGRKGCIVKVCMRVTIPTLLTLLPIRPSWSARAATTRRTRARASSLMLTCRWPAWIKRCSYDV